MKYSDFILQHFFQPQNVGCFDVDEVGVCTGRIGTVNVSDVLQLQLKIDSTGSIILAAKFQAYGNPYTIAGLSWLTTELSGKTLHAAQQLDYKFIAAAIACPQNKMHSALLIADVLQAAIADHNNLVNKQNVVIFDK